MTSQSNSTRQRLIRAALRLFAAQGVTETTTRQIAELAEVNEVTLFRQFGNKQGLLLAVIENTEMFARLGESLGQTASESADASQALRAYAEKCLQKLDQGPEFVRSLVGEAGKYSLENRQALGYRLDQINRYTTQYLTTIFRDQPLSEVSAEKLAGFLNLMLLGYAMLELTSELHHLWGDRHDFVTDLVKLLLQGAVSPLEESSEPVRISDEGFVREVADLPAGLVESVLQRAKKQSVQDYALAYVLFGAGLSPLEVASLRRSHYIQEPHQHLLQIEQEPARQVFLNQWIMGRRYGSVARNPLTRWLKTRKDDQLALFLNETGSPISEVEIRLRWQVWSEELTTPQGEPLRIEQVQQTWCVEMLLKGMSLENLSILSGQTLTQLQPYAQRAKEKVALEQAIQLDQKSGSKPATSSPPVSS